MGLVDERFDVLRTHDGTYHVLPTDITQYQRLDGCMRFLRWRLGEQNNGAAVLQRTLRRYEIELQQPAPLPMVLGVTFEQQLTKRLGESAIDYSGVDVVHNDEVRVLATELTARTPLYLLQPQLVAQLGSWTLRGRPDLIRMVRRDDQVLEVAIIDIKSSFAVKNEHQLQVAMYQLLLEHVLRPLSPMVQFDTGIIHRIPVDEPREYVARERLVRARARAREVFGWDDVCLDQTPHPDQFRDEAYQLFAFGHDSPLKNAIEAPFAELPFAYTASCEDCPYMELCLRHSAEQHDIALVPYMDRESRSALVEQQVSTIAHLAQLKPLDAQRRVVDTTRPTPQLQTLLRSEILGPYVDQWVVRAQRAQTHHDAQQVVGFTPDYFTATLPKIPAVGECMVLYIDAQRDHHNGALWSIGVLVEYFQQGVATHQIPLVMVSDTAPTPEHEAILVRTAFAQVQATIAQLVAAPVPLHVVVYEQTILQGIRQALERIADADPTAAAWHDVFTDPMTYRQARVTILMQDIKYSNQNPYVLSSLMAVSGRMGVSWSDAEHQFRALFRARHFDSMGRHPQTQAYYIRRARFSSAIPLEYAYAAWQQLPDAGASDMFASYRAMTLPVITKLLQQRLHALHTVTARYGRWYAPLPDEVDVQRLHHQATQAITLSDVLNEYMTFERNAQLRTWMDTHALAPANRVRALTSLMLEYRDADQSAPTRMRIQMMRQAQSKTPDQTVTGLQGMRIRWRVASDAHLPDVDTLFGSVPLASESHDAIVSQIADAQGKAESPAQLLYAGMRVKIVQRQHDESGSWLDGEIQSGRRYLPYQFGSRMMIPSDGMRYIIDESPDNIPASIQHQALQRLAENPHSNTLYRFLTGTPAAGLRLSESDMQQYLEAWPHGRGPVFVGDALRYVTSWASAPVLMVQGPPGTGKTFTTAHALLARIYAAMRRDVPLRIVVSCQTHAAIRAALHNIARVCQHLSAVPHPFAKLLQRFKVYRYRPTDGEIPIDGVDIVRDKGIMLTHLHAQKWCVVGATPISIESLAQASDPWCDLVVLDEASQMSLPLALAATQPLRQDGGLIVVGDPRQMPAIVSHDWNQEPRRRYQDMPVHLALFDYLQWLQQMRGHDIPLAKLAYSYRVPPRLADFLRHEIYAHDGIDYRGVHERPFPRVPQAEGFAAAVLAPEYPLVLVRHNEAQSTSHNILEAQLVVRILQPLIHAGYDAQTGFGVVVPHRMQRSTIRTLLRPHMPHLLTNALFQETNDVPGVDTVERYQGSERQVMVVSATESDIEYIRRNERFLFDRRRLNVALSRAQFKIIVVASQRVLNYIARDQDIALQSQMWKNYQNQWCTNQVWDGVVMGHEVEVFGG